MQQFWESDPVVEPAQAQGVQPVFTVPDPVGDAQRARDAENAARDNERADAAERRAQLTFEAEQEARAIGGDAAEAERKAAAFLIRALGANQAYEGTGVGPRSLPGQIAKDTIPDVANYFTSGERQTADSAQDEFIAATLRQDSGAAIPPEEMESQRRIYFPMPGDSEAAIEQKRQARLRAIEGLKQSSGRLLDDTLGRWESMSAGAPAPANAMTEYRTGGDGATKLTEDDRRAVALFQQAWDRGDSLQQLDALADSIGRARFSDRENIDELLRLREQGQPVDWVPEPTGERSDLERWLSDRAESGYGAFTGGLANAATAGMVDEIAGAVGGEGAQERAQFAKDTMRENNPVASFAGEVTGGALAMVPVARGAQLIGRGALAGEVAYGAAYGAGENNDNRLAGAAVGAGGALAGDYLGKQLLQRFGRKIPAEAGREGTAEAADAAGGALTPAQRYERAQRYGIDLSIGDVRGRGAKIVERTLDNMPLGGSVTGAARDRTRGQLNNAVDTVAGEFGTASTADSMGDALQAGARKWIARAKGEKGNPLDRGVIGKAYDAIPISANSPAQKTNTLAALEEINQQFSSNPQLRELMKDTQASRLLDALGDSGSELSWSDLKALRSAVGEDMSAMRISSQGSRQSNLSRLYGALSEDMRETARARGPAALARFERANTLNRQVEARIENTLTSILGRDGMQSAERAAQKVRAMSVSGRSTADFRQLAEIRKSMPAAEWGEVSSALIRLIGQPAGSEGREFSAQTFVRNFADMSAPAKNLIFGGPNSALRKNLDDFVEVVGDIAGSDATRNTSNTGMVVSGALGLTGGLPTLITQALSSYGAARLWTYPPFVRWATGYSKMLKRAAENGTAPSEAAVKSQLAHLDRIAKGGGPVSADVILLRDYMQNSLAQSPERLAAEPTEGDRQ